MKRSILIGCWIFVSGLVQTHGVIAHAQNQPPPLPIPSPPNPGIELCAVRWWKSDFQISNDRVKWPQLKDFNKEWQEYFVKRNNEEKHWVQNAALKKRIDDKITLLPSPTSFTYLLVELKGDPKVCGDSILSESLNWEKVGRFGWYHDDNTARFIFAVKDIFGRTDILQTLIGATSFTLSQSSPNVPPTDPKANISESKILKGEK